MKVLNEIRIWWGWFWFKIWLLLFIFFVLAFIGFAICPLLNIEQEGTFVPLFSETTRSVIFTISSVLTILIAITLLTFIKNYRIDIEKMKDFKKRNPTYGGMIDTLIFQAKIDHKTKKVMQWLTNCNSLVMKEKELKEKEGQIKKLRKEVKVLEQQLSLWT